MVKKFIIKKIMIDKYDNFIWFNRYSKPNNLLLGLEDNSPYPFLDLIFNNINDILLNYNNLKCIYCITDINYDNYNGINKYIYENTVFCPVCKINTIVPKIKIPEPTNEILKEWHILSFGLFAHRPISGSESDSETD